MNFPMLWRRITATISRLRRPTSRPISVAEGEWKADASATADEAELRAPAAPGDASAPGANAAVPNVKTPMGANRSRKSAGPREESGGAVVLEAVHRQEIVVRGDPDLRRIQVFHDRLVEPGAQIRARALDRNAPIHGERRDGDQRDRACGGGVQLDRRERDHAVPSALPQCKRKVQLRRPALLAG